MNKPKGQGNWYHTDITAVLPNAGSKIPATFRGGFGILYGAYKCPFFIPRFLVESVVLFLVPLVRKHKIEA
jgi:hypothetical protein